jgi:predicted glycoside hydrolase/deacetylase ChbG (UPF0249 family)
VRRLIVNADDFGLTAGVNRAIAECVRGGIVTSATIMARSAAFEDAATSARAMTQEKKPFSAGCHVVLIDGEPVLAADKIPSLVESSGRFRDKLLGFARDAVSGKVRAEEIEAEVTAQIQKIQAASIAVSHVDSHKHTHIFPAIFRPLLAAAKACGVGAVRNPFVPVKPLAYAHLLRRPGLWKRYSQVRMLRRYEDAFRDEVSRLGMKTTDGTFGIVATGSLDAGLFEAVVSNIPEGTWEFVCHPGYNDPDLNGIKTRLRESRVRELEVLTSERAKQALVKQGIELITYNQL